jgi:hypothetical protein
MKKCWSCKKEMSIPDDLLGDYNCEHCNTQNSFYPEPGSGEDKICQECIERIGTRPKAYCEICLKNREANNADVIQENDREK